MALPDSPATVEAMRDRVADLEQLQENILDDIDTYNDPDHDTNFRDEMLDELARQLDDVARELRVLRFTLNGIDAGDSSADDDDDGDDDDGPETLDPTFRGSGR